MLNIDHTLIKTRKKPAQMQLDNARRLYTTESIISLSVVTCVTVAQNQSKIKKLPFHF